MGENFHMFRSLFIALAVVAVSAGVARADEYVGTASFTDKNAGGAADFTAPDANIDQTDPNGITVQDFLVVSTTDTATKTNTQNDNLVLTFKFTEPNKITDKEDGTGTEIVTISGKTDLTTGVIDWDNDGVIDIDFTDGSVLDIALSFDPLDSIFVTTDGNQDLTLAYNATFTVPEPASLAIIGGGLLGLAALRRRRSV